MGMQIEFAQSPKDEGALIIILSNRYNLRCLPRTFSDPSPNIAKLDAAGFERLIIFPPEVEGSVLNNIRPVIGGEGEFHVFPRDNLCIEWNRSAISEDGLCHYGRCYLADRKNGDGATSKQMRQVMSFIVRYVKSVSPKISVLSPPVYIGSDVVELIEKGNVRGVAYRGGSIMELCPNPDWSPGTQGNGS
jgi:hypothetical protein